MNHDQQRDLYLDMMRMAVQMMQRASGIERILNSNQTQYLAHESDDSDAMFLEDSNVEILSEMSGFSDDSLETSSLYSEDDEFVPTLQLSIEYDPHELYGSGETMAEIEEFDISTDDDDYVDSDSECCSDAPLDMTVLSGTSLSDFSNASDSSDF